MTNYQLVGNVQLPTTPGRYWLYIRSPLAELRNNETSRSFVHWKLINKPLVPDTILIFSLDVSSMKYFTKMDKDKKELVKVEKATFSKKVISQFKYYARIKLLLCKLCYTVLFPIYFHRFYIHVVLKHMLAIVVILLNLLALASCSFIWLCGFLRDSRPRSQLHSAYTSGCTAYVWFCTGSFCCIIHNQQNV